MIQIDGAYGEGGGQILRSALTLSLVTGKPFRIDNIRSGRKKPGLMRQHLTAVNAAAEIGCAEIEGNHIGSRAFTFRPGQIRHGRFRYAIGSAGSCTLVLQTILPALIKADGPSTVTLEGGTHNPYAPPYDFLEKAFLPLLRKMGVQITANLERPGFYPAGGGRMTVTVSPPETLDRLALVDRGELVRKTARAVVANLPLKIAQRELKVVGQALEWGPETLEAVEAANAKGPGNILTVEIESRNVTEVFTGFGERGVSAEKVADRTVREIRAYLAADVPVGHYLADQLLLPMAMAGGGKFRTLSPSRHTTTNIEIIKKFLDVDIVLTESGDGQWEIDIRRA